MKIKTKCLVFSLFCLSSLALSISDSFAAPFVVCDVPAEAITHYKLTGPSWVPVSVPSQTDKSIKLDISQASVGVNAITVAACIMYPDWGESCSDFVPFSFTRPARPVSTKGIRLTQ